MDFLRKFFIMSAVLLSALIVVVLTGFCKSSVRRFWNVSKIGGKSYQKSVKTKFSRERLVNFWWRITLHFGLVLANYPNGFLSLLLSLSLSFSSYNLGSSSV